MTGLESRSRQRECSFASIFAGSGVAPEASVRSISKYLPTRTALTALSSIDIAGALFRHQHGAWGNVGREDWQANERALRQGERLLSVYKTADGTKFWIITEWDRSLTTILLPEDY